ncbi:MAG: tRNA-dihydrouridine synthase [bacterium]|nr:tRNA-dihydrouridine synthase [bacterium]
MSDKNSFWQRIKKPILALAPMAGVNNPAFRLICKKFGADVLYTEMISAAGLTYGGKKTLAYLAFDRKEKPVVAQLFGSRSEDFKKAAKIVEKAGLAGVDINLGCPARKVIKNKSGSALMQDLETAYQIIKISCEATHLPVSIKIRNSKGDVQAIDLIKKIKDLPVRAIMIHGRSYEQGFSGDPNWSEFKKIRKIYHGILLANGGVDNPEDAKKVLRETGADGLGLARVTWGRPWIFQQIKDYLRSDKYHEPLWSEKLKIIFTHARMAVKDEYSLLEFRKHLLWYARGVPGAAHLRQQLMEAKNLEEIEKILKGCF